MPIEKEERICEIHGLTVFAYYSRGIEGRRWLCCKCSGEKTAKHHRRKKVWCIEYLGGSCTECGYNRCINALEFHHLNPEEKEFGIAVEQKLTEKEIKIELDKCVLLCANCHREIHDKYSDIGTEYLVETSESVFDKRREKLTQEQVNEIRSLKGIVRGKQLAETYNVTVTHISKIQNNKTWAE